MFSVNYSLGGFLYRYIYRLEMRYYQIIMSGAGFDVGRQRWHSLRSITNWSVFIPGYILNIQKSSGQLFDYKSASAETQGRPRNFQLRSKKKRIICRNYYKFSHQRNLLFDFRIVSRTYMSVARRSNSVLLIGACRQTRLT